MVINMVETVGIAVQFMWSPVSPRVGESVTFTDVTGNIYKMDFGDGRYWVSEGASDKFPVKHTYTKAGTYKAIAIGKDINGNIGTDTQSIVVSDGSEPEPEPEPKPGYLASLIAALIALLKAIFGKK